MNNKRIFGIFVLTLFVSFLFINSVSAQNENAFGGFIITVANGVSNLIEGLKPLINTVLGDSSGFESFSDDQIVIAKLLIFLLLMSVICMVLQRVKAFDNHGWVVWMIAIIVPILGIRFLTPEIIAAAALPSSVLGVAVTAILPLAIYAAFVETSFTSSTLRKIAWLLAAFLFLGIYFVNFTAIGKLAYYYLAAAFACLAFLYFDGTIRRLIDNNRLENAKKGLHSGALLTWQSRMAKVQSSYDANPSGYMGVYSGSGSTGTAAYHADIDYINGEISKILKAK